MRKVNILEEFNNLFLESTKISKKFMKIRNNAYQIKGVDLFLKISREYLLYRKENFLVLE